MRVDTFAYRSPSLFLSAISNVPHCISTSPKASLLPTRVPISPKPSPNHLITYEFIKALPLLQSILIPLISF